VEQIGLTYHSHETGPYWDESACYELTHPEVDALESAGNALHKLCIQAAERVVEEDLWHRLGIPAIAVPAIRDSWERDDFSLYGRFDFAFDGTGPPKLLEYNADTPTSLIEAAVAQWFWLEECKPGADQFNSIHERLIEAWKRWATGSCSGGAGPAGLGHDGPATLYFSSIKEHEEDEQTVLYLQDTCTQAGVQTRRVFVEDIGWDARQDCYVDLDLQAVRHCFKLYPWEWLWEEEFGRHLVKGSVQMIEPAWKMLLSNKGLLPLLWELFTDHPNLLPAFESAEPLHGDFVRKPKLSREGSNVQCVQSGAVVAETDGGYGGEGYVYQAMAALPEYEGNRPVCGVWIVDHEAAGLGIREDTGLITANLSRFVPHFFA